MNKKISKKKAIEEINEFFYHIRKKSPEEIKKIKKLAMSHKIKLEDKKKLFCKKCLFPYQRPSIHIKNGSIKITCENCNHLSKWKFKGRIKNETHSDGEECG